MASMSSRATPACLRLFCVVAGFCWIPVAAALDCTQVRDADKESCYEYNADNYVNRDRPARESPEYWQNRAGSGSAPKKHYLDLLEEGRREREELQRRNAERLRPEWAPENSTSELRDLIGGGTQVKALTGALNRDVRFDPPLKGTRNGIGETLILRNDRIRPRVMALLPDVGKAAIKQVKKGWNGKRYEKVKGCYWNKDVEVIAVLHPSEDTFLPHGHAIFRHTCAGEVIYGTARIGIQENGIDFTEESLQRLVEATR